MKSDMDLVRNLLFLIEDTKIGEVLKVPDDMDREVVAYHLKIMEQAGYVINKIRYADNKPYLIYSEITWDGQELLDSIKNESVWRKVKDVVKENGGNVSYEILKEVAVQFSRKMILGE